MNSKPRCFESSVTPSSSGAEAVAMAEEGRRMSVGKVWSKALFGAVKALVTVGNRVVSTHQDQRIRVWKRSKGRATVFKLVATMLTVKDCVVGAMSQKNYLQTRRHHWHLWIEHADAISCLAVSTVVKKCRKLV